MELSVDRLESEYVVCIVRSSLEIINLSRTIFPSDIKEGDLVTFEDGIITRIPNTEQKNRIKEKMKLLRKE